MEIILILNGSNKLLILKEKFTNERKIRSTVDSMKEELFECRKEKGKGEKIRKRLGEKLGEEKGKRKGRRA